MISTFPFLVFVFILGSIIGSFLSCLVHRLRYQQRVTSGRSTCPTCHQTLQWYELIPVASFIIQRGKCRSCKSGIAVQDILLEIITGILFVGVVVIRINPEASLATGVLVVRDWIFISVLLAIFVFDLRWQLIPDQITIPAALFAFAINILLYFPPLSSGLGIEQGVIPGTLYLLLAMIVGGGFFLLQFMLSRGTWIGGGDIRLGVVMGAMLGWPGILIALMVSYILGAVISVTLVIIRLKTWKSPVPFGTFLTIATVVAMYWGTEIVQWYSSLL